MEITIHSSPATRAIPEQGIGASNTKFRYPMRHNWLMTNSTPTLLIWLVQYRKYLDLVQQDLLDQAELVKAEIKEGLPDAELCWEDLERAAQNLKQWLTDVGWGLRLSNHWSKSELTSNHIKISKLYETKTAFNNLFLPLFHRVKSNIERSHWGFPAHQQGYVKPRQKQE